MRRQSRYAQATFRQALFRAAKGVANEENWNLLDTRMRHKATLQHARTFENAENVFHI